MNTQLDTTLLKYKGLVFTDETMPDCKKTIAELRKGQKALNDFKIKTKKQLNKAVDDFEGKCKLLDDKFNVVIEPISKQAADFEVQRKEDKKVEIKGLINNLIIENGLEPKYSINIVISDHMLNKGTTIKAITEKLTSLAEGLKFNQNLEHSIVSLIKSKVELANKEYGVLLLESTYLDMMEHKEIEEIARQIVNDAETLKAKREAIELEKKVKAERLEVARKLEVEKQAKEAELKEVAKAKEIERQAQLEATREEEKARQAIIDEANKKAVAEQKEARKHILEAKEAIALANIEKAKEVQEIHDYSKVEKVVEIAVENEKVVENEPLQYVEYRVCGSKAEIDEIDTFLNNSPAEIEVVQRGTL